MHILYLNGNFFEQLNQYIFLRCCEVIDNEEVLIDDTYFYSDFGYDEIELLKVFPNIKLKFLKDNYDEDKWDSMVQKCLEADDKIQMPNVLEEEENIVVKVVADDNFFKTNVGKKTDGSPDISFTETHTFSTQSLKVTSNLMAKNWRTFKPFRDKDTQIVHENVFYLGKWKHNDFIKPIRKYLKEELQFKSFEKEENIQHMENILSKNGSIGIHINSKVFTSYESSKIINSYVDEMKKIRREVMKVNGKPAFFFFCDDIDECEEAIDQFNINSDDEIFYIETGLTTEDGSDSKSLDNDLSFDFGFDDDEDNEEKYFDIHIMTYCDYLIAQSSYFEPLLAGSISQRNKQFVLLGNEKKAISKPVHKPKPKATKSSKSKKKKKK